jgi:hypothetical protein
MTGSNMDLIRYKVRILEQTLSRHLAENNLANFSVRQLEESEQNCETHRFGVIFDSYSFDLVFADSDTR